MLHKVIRQNNKSKESYFCINAQANVLSLEALVIGYL